MRNILVDKCLIDYFQTYKFYKAKLADFGLAKEYNKDESAQNSGCINGYSEHLSTTTLLPWPIMAPELLLAFSETKKKPAQVKNRLFTESSDMWSFGLLIAECLNLKEGSCRIGDNCEELTTIFTQDAKGNRKVLQNLKSCLEKEIDVFDSSWIKLVKEE